MNPSVQRSPYATAVADGRLIDVSATARDAGVNCPISLSRAAWEDCVAWTKEDAAQSNVVQDEAQRLWDILWMLRIAFSTLSGPSTNAISFELYRVPRRVSHARPELVKLVARTGMDGSTPVLIIGLPAEL